MPVREIKPPKGEVTAKKTGKVPYGNRYDDVQVSRFGIYAYIDEHDRVAYIGKDSQIKNGTRKSRHESDKYKGEQKLHKSLINHPENFRYEVWAICKDSNVMEDVEASLIAQFKAIGECYLNVLDELGGE